MSYKCSIGECCRRNRRIRRNELCDMHFKQLYNTSITIQLCMYRAKIPIDIRKIIHGYVVHHIETRKCGESGCNSFITHHAYCLIHQYCKFQININMQCRNIRRKNSDYCAGGTTHSQIHYIPTINTLQ